MRPVEIYEQMPSCQAHAVDSEKIYIRGVCRIQGQHQDVTLLLPTLGSCLLTVENRARASQAIKKL